MCAGGFTSAAEEWTRAHARRRVTLVNLNRFVELWTKYYPRLDAVEQRRLPLSPIYFLTLES
jgi:restriction system protein